jgi:hypothetical protein
MKRELKLEAPVRRTVAKSEQEAQFVAVSSARILRGCPLVACGSTNPEGAAFPARSSRGEGDDGCGALVLGKRPLP